MKEFEALNDEKYKKKHTWIIRILILLIKAHRENKKLSVSEIRAKLDKSSLYDDITFEQKEARIWKSLEWMSKHDKLSDIKSTKSFFSSNDEFSEIFNEQTSNLKVVRFGDLWGLE